jgi:hypothetical protein
MYFYIADVTIEEEATLTHIASTSSKHKVALINDILLKRRNLDCLFNPTGWLRDDVSADTLLLTIYLSLPFICNKVL